jgi:hypothetical protein
VIDAEEAVLEALEPGEKVVWSDHPHGIGRAMARAILAEAWLFFIAGPTMAFAVFLVFENAKGPAPPIAVLLSFVFVIGVFLGRRVAVLLGERYFVTDKGRLFVHEGGGVRWTELPPRDLVTTKARGNEEFADVHLGSAITLHDVSYPLIAVETLRSVARAKPNC